MGEGHQAIRRAHRLSLHRAWRVYRRATFIALALASAASQAAPAATYPVRPLRLIVPQSAGGSTDLVARPFALQLAETLKQPVVVDNRPGAGSVIGSDLAAKSAPDGYTLLVVAASFTMSPSLYRLPYDPVRDFAPISQLSVLPNLLVVQPALPVKTVPELVAYVKARPGQLNFGSSGVATGTHMSMEMFMAMTGTRLVHVPYKGGALSVNALLGGEVQASFATISTALPFVKSGRLRALAVSTARRSTALPDVPTVAESGVTGYDYSSWIGLLAPAGTPQPVIARLGAEAARIVHTPEMKSLLATEGSEPVGNSAAAFGAIIRSETARWRKIVAAAGIKAE